MQIPKVMRIGDEIITYSHHDTVRGHYVFDSSNGGQIRVGDAEERQETDDERAVRRAGVEAAGGRWSGKTAHRLTTSPLMDLIAACEVVE